MVENGEFLLSSQESYNCEKVRLLYSDNPNIKQEKIDACIIWVLYFVLTAMNLWYFTTRIFKLNQKGFHLMMFCLLQFCYLCYILEYVAVWAQASKTIIVFTYYFYYGCNSVAHGIFVMKYWVLSRKI